jgi:hypothetical protein
MDERTIESSRHDGSRFASDLSSGCEYRRGMPVEISIELLLGGLRTPGFIEYNAEADWVTFTIKKSPCTAHDMTWPMKAACNTDGVQPRL